MRHLVGYFLVSSALVGCSLSEVGSMDPVEGGKCDKPMATATAKDGCSVCTCDGTTWSCDSEACAAGCTEGDTKLADDGCNTCSCDDSGNWGCTELGCGSNGCTPGDTAKAADGCSSCTCSADGTWGCSQDGNCGGMVECKPGETKLGDGGCYRCSCDDAGRWACPDIACTKCMPGEASHSDCLDCVCSDEGTWSCTGALDGRCGGMQCTPGETVPAADGCNTCTCLMDGTMGCTLIDCTAMCPAPFMKAGCEEVPTFAQDPATGLCCEYTTSCAAPAMWKSFDSMEACRGGMGMVCASGTADCDGDSMNGCETDLLFSPDNCGSCGQTCLSPTGDMGKCDQGKCVYAGGEPQTCLYQGVTYSAGASFPSRDGCNTCGCLDTGMGTTEIACTDRACACDPANEPFRKYAATSVDECKVTDQLDCPPNTINFTNECGCGCEQSIECPDVYKCAPDGADMTCVELAKQCPYTELVGG